MFRLGVQTLPTVSLACGGASWSLSHQCQLPPPPTWREKWPLRDPCPGWVSLCSHSPCGAPPAWNVRFEASQAPRRSVQGRCSKVPACQAPWKAQAS